MQYSSYRVIPNRIKRRQDFEGNTMRGQSFPSGCGYIPRGAFSQSPPVDAIYVIWSYSTPIAWVLANGDGYVTNETYGPTTGKHKSNASAVYTDAQNKARIAAWEAEWKAKKRLRIEREAYKINAQIDKRNRMEAYVAKHLPRTIENLTASAMAVTS